jgi:hypothetical protein
MIYFQNWSEATDTCKNLILYRGKNVKILKTKISSIQILLIPLWKHSCKISKFKSLLENVSFFPVWVAGLFIEVPRLQEVWGIQTGSNDIQISKIYS